MASEQRIAELRLAEKIEALAAALYAAGLRSGSKDGVPRLIDEGVYANLVRVQRLDLHRVTPADSDEAWRQIQERLGPVTPEASHPRRGLSP